MQDLIIYLDNQSLLEKFEFNNNKFIINFLNNKYLYYYNSSILYNIYIGIVIKKHNNYYIVKINDNVFGILFIENIIGNINLNEYILVQVIREENFEKQHKISMYIEFYGIYCSLKLIDNSINIYNLKYQTMADIEVNNWYKIINNTNLNNIICVYKTNIWNYIYRYKLHLNCNRICTQIEIPNDLIDYIKSENILLNTNIYQKILLPSSANIIYEQTSTCHFFDINTNISNQSQEDINIEAINKILENGNLFGNIIIDLLKQENYINLNHILQRNIQKLNRNIKTYLITDIGILVLNISQNNII